MTSPVPYVSPARQVAKGVTGGSYAASFTSPPTATEPTTTAAATVPFILPRLTANPYTQTRPHNLAEDLASEGHPLTISKVTERDDISNLKWEGLTGDDFDNAKSRGLLPPDGGDSDNVGALV